MLFISSILSASAQSHSAGSNASFTGYRFDGEYYLLLTFEDDNDNRLRENTIVKFLFNDGRIIKLNGNDGSKELNYKSNFWGDAEQKNKHYALLSIKPEEIEMLKVGIDKIIINTVPETYKRSKFKGKDQLGKTLYDDFKSLKDDFEE